MKSDLPHSISRQMRNRMKAIVSAALLVLCLTQTGCMTLTTVDSAKGHSYKDRDGREVVAKKPKPENYLLVPLAVAGDVITFPGQCLIFILFLNYRGC